MRGRITCALFVTLLCWVSAAFASSYTVNDLGDAPDATPGDDICATTGAVCTLRAAMQEANAHAGVDDVSFSVVGTIAPLTPFPLLTDKVTIDATSAPGYIGSPEITVDGAGTVPDGIVFSAGSNGSTLSGMQVQGCSLHGVLVSASSIHLSANVVRANTLDGIELAAGSSICFIMSSVIFQNGRHGIHSSGAANVSISGSTIYSNGQDGVSGTFVSVTVIDSRVGVDASGDVPAGNGGNGLHFTGGSDVYIGGGAPCVISANGLDGIRIETGLRTTITGNRIGTNSSGTAALGNLGAGIKVIDSVTTKILANIVSGNRSGGISLSGVTGQTSVDQNIVGRNVANTAAIPNAVAGVLIDGATSYAFIDKNVVGSNDAAAAGISVLNGAIADISNNSIFDNSALGIDLGGDGPTPNDALDADTGPNRLQNYPVLSGAINTGTQTVIEGSLNSMPSTTFEIQFFSSRVADPSGFGEGQQVLGGGVSVTTDAAGNASLGLNTTPLPIGTTITATASASPLRSGGTSEFSSGVSVNPPPVIQFSSATTSVSEGAGAAILTVTRTGDLGLQTFVTYTLASVTATPGSDYVVAGNQATFLPGVATQTISVPVIDDNVHEGNETFTVTLSISGPSPAILGTPAVATVTIVDDDPVPAATINDVSLAEGNSGATAFTFTVTLSNASSSNVSVDYATADGTATAGSDYNATSGTLTIAAGSTTGTVTVTGIGDTAVEGGETFFVNLTNPVNASIADAQGVGTLTNDDAPLPAITINDVSAAEDNSGTTSFTFTVTLSAASSSNVSVDYATANGTATAGSDYNATSGTLTIPAGSTTGAVTVNGIGDTAVEGDETFFLNLTNPVNASIADAQGVGTLTNDDAPLPAITINDVSLAEGNSGTTAFTFTVTLSNASSSNVSVDYATANGSATAGSDYNATSGTLTIPAGSTTGTVTVTGIGDTAVEGDETFFVNLTNPVNATIGDAQGVGTATNDDAAPAPAAVPTMSDWMLLALACALVIAGLGPSFRCAVT